MRPEDETRTSRPGHEPGVCSKRNEPRDWAPRVVVLRACPIATTGLLFPDIGRSERGERLKRVAVEATHTTVELSIEELGLLMNAVWQDPRVPGATLRSARMCPQPAYRHRWDRWLPNGVEDKGL